VTRSLCLEVLLSRYAQSDALTVLAAVRAATGASTVVGCTLVVASSALAMLGCGASPGTTALLGAMLVPILIQDALRFYWLASGRPAGAAANDGACLIGTIAAAVALSSAGYAGVTAVFGSWALGAGLAAGIAFARVGVLPDIRRGVPWIWAHRSVGLPLAGGTLVAQGSARVSLAAVGAIAGLTQLGMVAASMTILAPLNVLSAGCYLYGVAEAARRVRAGRIDLGRLIAALSGAVTSCIVVVAAVCLAVPDGIGAAVLGSNWSAGQACLVPVLVWFLSSALLVCLKCAMRAFGDNQVIFRLYVVQGLAQVASASVGAAMAGALGAAWGVASASALCLLCWLRAYRAVMSRSRRPRFDCGSGSAVDGLPVQRDRRWVASPRLGIGPSIEQVRSDPRR
jgi:O-antigen/teichoic acid export membrane protein